MHVDETREKDGSLPAYAWPGGYPIAYSTEDGAVLCPGCANGENGSEAYTDGRPWAETFGDGEPVTDPQWHVVASFVHWEGPPEVCDHCGAEIESAYGDPDEAEPSEGDYAMTPCGQLGSRIAVSQVEGKFLGEFPSRREAEAFIREHSEAEQFWPNVWYVSDHGNWHSVTV